VSAIDDNCLHISNYIERPFTFDKNEKLLFLFEFPHAAHLEGTDRLLGFIGFCYKNENGTNNLPASLNIEDGQLWSEKEE
jgi:hypothetical protein